MLDENGENVKGPLYKPEYTDKILKSYKMLILLTSLA
jgi:hypothetical protein